ncbi:LptA/OstA family protein [Rubritalea spongiae]
MALSITPCLLAQKKSPSEAIRQALPVGSSLHKVRIPQFDENYRKTSILTAQQIDTLADNKLKGTHVHLELFEHGEEQLSAHFNAGTYYEGHEILHSTQNIELSGEIFDIAAQGVILDWKKRSGFLLGKTQTLFYPKRNTKMRSSKTQMSPIGPKKQKNTLSSASQKIAVIGSSIPALLTAEELQNIDTLARPSTEQVAQVDQNTAKDEASSQLKIQTAEQQKTALKDKTFPIVDEQITPTETAKPLTKRENQVPVSVVSEKGMYFDATTGTAVYQNNVVVTHPQVHLTCSDELKIFLKKVETPAATETSEGGLDKFEGVDQAIATGNVIIKAKDSSGKIITTNSEIATYDGDTGIIILKGGRPTVQQGSQIARILSDSGYIKILPNMSVRIVGKHEIQADLNELQKQ